MGEILGIGATHYPPGLVPDQYKAWPLARMLHDDPRIPDYMRDVSNWPEPMRLEWGDDEGVTSHAPHRARIFKAFRTIRQKIDEFNPDFVIIVGDDQYENFKEDIIPPFCVLAYEEMHSTPFHRLGERPNIWDEPNDKVFNYQGYHMAGRALARGLLREGIDMSYAYKPLHGDALGHAFANTLLYLDLDRQGFNYPVLPLAVNCYGSNVIRYRGGASQFEVEPDPPSPSPRRCFEMGQAVARVLQNSPWRVCLLASSSWSHGFLTEKNHFMYPDVEADRARLEELKAGEHAKWRDIPLEQIEDSGHQELLNWVCLAGAMHEAGQTADVLDWVETWVYNAGKCMAIFK